MRVLELGSLMAMRHAVVFVVIVIVIVIVIVMSVLMGVPYSVEMLVLVQVGEIAVLFRILIDGHARPFVGYPWLTSTVPPRCRRPMPVRTPKPNESPLIAGAPFRTGAPATVRGDRFRSSRGNLRDRTPSSRAIRSPFRESRLKCARPPPSHARSARRFLPVEPPRRCST